MICFTVRHVSSSQWWLAWLTPTIAITLPLTFVAKGQGPLVRSRAEFLKLQQGSAEDWSQMSPEELTAFKESQPGMLPTHSRNRVTTTP
jgi:hypothetical protein